MPLEALILAFRYSRAGALVGTDALRTVLSGQYRELHRDGAFDLEPVWQLCAEQPGFDAAHVRPPLCRFKTWEPALGLEVRLPTSMAGLSPFEVVELAAQVRVPPRERARVFEGGQVRSGDPEAAAAPAEAWSGPSAPDLAPPETARTPVLRRLGPAQRRALEIALVLLALAGFGAAGLQLQRGCGGGAWESMSTAFAADIPLRGAERQGPEVSGGLRDARWLALSPAARAAHMKGALEALPRDVQAFFVRDDQGRVRAIARRFGRPPQIQVTFL